MRVIEFWLKWTIIKKLTPVATSLPNTYIINYFSLYIIFFTDNVLEYNTFKF